MEDGSSSSSSDCIPNAIERHFSGSESSEYWGRAFLETLSLCDLNILPTFRAVRRLRAAFDALMYNFSGSLDSRSEFIFVVSNGYNKCIDYFLSCIGMGSIRRRIICVLSKSSIRCP
jgi:hypothetical protein